MGSGGFILDGGRWWWVYFEWWWVVVGLFWVLVEGGRFVMGGCGCC